MTNIDSSGPTGGGPIGSSTTSAAVSGPVGSGTLTASDIATMNRVAIVRAAAFTRIVGSAMIVVGLMGTATWLWLTVRTQQRLQASLFGFDVPIGAPEPTEPSLLDRLDAVPPTAVLLLLAVMALGAGTLLRLVADYAVARTGGSLTGFEVGDVLPPDDSEDDGSDEFQVE